MNGPNVLDSDTEQKRQDDAGGVFLPNRDTFSQLAPALIKPRSHLVLIVSFRVPRHSLISVTPPHPSPRGPLSVTGLIDNVRVFGTEDSGTRISANTGSTNSLRAAE